MKTPSFSAISQRILEILRRSPTGLSIDAIRDQLGDVGTQQHLDRRLRELDPHFVIDRVRQGRNVNYVLRGKRKTGEWVFEKISKTIQAKILHAAGGRCQMCGKTIADDNVRLHIDHKVPQSWGGKTVEENLWAICSVCNEGKKNYFSSFDSDLMKTVLTHKSVHRRIAELLRVKRNQWVDCDLIQFVANENDFQTDWRKRLRELRYLGLEIDSRNVKHGRRTVSQYRLTKWVEMPSDPSAAARAHERSRKK